HINALGTVHGGFVATVLDTALGLTIYISIDDAARHTTVDLAVKIVKRVPLATPLVVETSLVHVSRSVGVSQGVLRDDAGTVYAHGTTTCHIKR
ncbi:MAG: PaaI family thioesterase, partial [Gammaproteobacteria bacterium]